MTPRVPRVLIIDDDVDQLQIVRAALEGKCEVQTAADGLDGYALACAERPTVVVLDVMMPLVDGWTVLRKLRANPLTKDTRIIIATALDREAVAGEAALLNVSLVLSKPIDLQQLKNAIARLDATAGR